MSRVWSSFAPGATPQRSASSRDGSDGAVKDDFGLVFVAA